MDDRALRSPRLPTGGFLLCRPWCVPRASGCAVVEDRPSPRPGVRFALFLIAGPVVVTGSAPGPHLPQGTAVEQLATQTSRRVAIGHQGRVKALPPETSRCLHGVEKSGEHAAWPIDEVEAMRYCETRCGEQQVPFRDNIAVTRRDEVQLVLTEPSEILGCRGFPLSMGSDAVPNSF